MQRYKTVMEHLVRRISTTSYTNGQTLKSSSLKSRYFKLDDVSYPLRIMYRYLLDIFWYVSREYPKIIIIF